MTKAEILKQIEELKQQIEALPDDEKKIRTMPNRGESFTHIGLAKLCYYTNSYPDLFDMDTTKENSSIGNYFKSQDDAEMVVKAMKIEQAIRIRRIELNDGWEPDWDEAVERKYYVYFTSDGYLTVYKSFLNKFLPIFGYYKTEEIARQIIDEFEDELFWYFNEYYQNKDKMYVWGENDD